MLHCDLGYLLTTEKYDWCRIRAHYELLSEIERGQDKARPYAGHVAVNCLTACQTLPWSARTPDLSSIEHVWDMIGRRLHLPGHVDDLGR
ncbi:transposable element Tcb1 transposase [Trichonephila clavipes]|nr:transposable element Tcb1 transposase [Trichonephila clavipes]